MLKMILLPLSLWVDRKALIYSLLARENEKIYPSLTMPAQFYQSEADVPTQ